MPLQQARLALNTWGGGAGCHWYNPEAIFSLFKKKKKIEKMVFQYFFFSRIPIIQLGAMCPCEKEENGQVVAGSGHGDML